LINLFSFDFTYAQLLLFLTVGILTGMSKTGVHGAGMLSVPLLALIF